MTKSNIIRIDHLSQKTTDFSSVIVFFKTYCRARSFPGPAVEDSEQTEQSHLRAPCNTHPVADHTLQCRMAALLQYLPG